MPRRRRQGDRPKPKKAPPFPPTRTKQKTTTPIAADENQLASSNLGEEAPLQKHREEICDGGSSEWLPEEVWEIIFSFMEHPQDRMTAARVCKRWNVRAKRDVFWWRAQCLSRGLDVECFALIQRMRRALQKSQEEVEEFGSLLDDDEAVEDKSEEWIDWLRRMSQGDKNIKKGRHSRVLNLPDHCGFVVFGSLFVAVALAGWLIFDMRNPRHPVLMKTIEAQCVQSKVALTRHPTYPNHLLLIGSLGSLDLFNPTSLVTVIDVESGKELASIARKNSPYVIKTSRDGRWLMLREEEGDLSLWDIRRVIAGDTARPSFALLSREVSQAAFAPGFLLVVSLPPESCIKVYALGDDKPTGIHTFSICTSSRVWDMTANDKVVAIDVGLRCAIFDYHTGAQITATPLLPRITPFRRSTIVGDVLLHCSNFFEHSDKQGRLQIFGIGPGCPPLGQPIKLPVVDQEVSRSFKLDLLTSAYDEFKLYHRQEQGGLYVIDFAGA